MRRMTELNQVIYDIERCTCHVPDACRDCSKYKGTYTPDCMEQLLTDALKLLKEQSEIVHCKNCKWFSEKGFCKHPDGGAGNIRPTGWFCGDGKRREVE